MPDDAISIEERKKRLIAQGLSFRAQVIHAKGDVHAALRPNALAKGAVGHIASMLGDRQLVRNAGANLTTLLPLLVSGMSAMSKGFLKKPPTKPLTKPPAKRSMKPLTRAALAGAVAAVAMLLFTRKIAQRKASGEQGAR